MIDAAKIKSIWGDILHLVYPEKCLVCSSELTKKEKDICSVCRVDITYTHFHHFIEANSIDKIFTGRIKTEATYAHLFFEKSKVVQKILFDIKYKNNHALANYFGEEMGGNILQIEKMSSVDILLPIPLHPKKEFIRGYNQSEEIAKGVMTSFPVELGTRYIYRTKHTQTQTRKNRFDRWDNVADVFQIKKEIKEFRHALIIDDVLTTGATIEHFVYALKKVHPKIKISISTLAIAK